MLYSVPHYCLLPPESITKASMERPTVKSADGFFRRSISRNMWDAFLLLAWSNMCLMSLKAYEELVLPSLLSSLREGFCWWWCAAQGMTLYDYMVPCATHRWKHYGNALVHDDCYCHKCDMIFDDRDDLDEVGYPTSYPAVDSLVSVAYQRFRRTFILQSLWGGVWRWRRVGEGTAKAVPLLYWLGRWKHYFNSSSHEDCVCHMCGFGFEYEHELEEVTVYCSWPTNTYFPVAAQGRWTFLLLSMWTLVCR